MSDDARSDGDDPIADDVAGTEGSDALTDASPGGADGHRPEPIDADAALIARARSRYGKVGGVVAGGMLGLEKVLGRPAKEEIPVVWEAAGEPLDIDRTGITVPVDGDSSVTSQPGARRRGYRAVPKRRRDTP